MALNPFFIQGSSGEQNLVQDLINEQLRMYGIDVTYIPRKFVNKQSIIEEVQSSKFDDNFTIEAYLQNYDGFQGNGDILTKFGITLKDEVQLIISKERFTDFIRPFMDQMDDDEVEFFDTPREGDLIYFPLGKKLFEIKYVEVEKPFFMLRKNYVFELRCELFEYENEVLDTGIDSIDKTVLDEGFITTLNIVGNGSTALGTASTTTGYVGQVFLQNDGYGFTSTPLVTFTSPPVGFTTATAVAITTTMGTLRAVEAIRLTNAGYGYSEKPTIFITGGGGSGAIATCTFVVGSGTSFGVGEITVGTSGTQYAASPTVAIGTAPAGGVDATAFATLNSRGQVDNVYITNAGAGYTEAPSITFSGAPQNGSGSYVYNELVTGQSSNTTARVREWDATTNVLKVGIVTGTFYDGETVVGSASSATYTVRTYTFEDTYDAFNEGDVFETEADLIVDFSEKNPFGDF